MNQATSLSIEIVDVQHIERMSAVFDLSDPVICVVGRNGCGKTTLIRALRNLVQATTFKDTASPYIFSESSRIDYGLDGQVYSYRYDSKIKALDSRQPFSRAPDFRVELPLPYGDRFNHYQKLGDIDEELRAKIQLGEYQPAQDLMQLYELIYDLEPQTVHRFKNLMQIDIKQQTYYFVLLDNQTYIREDYFSSGEYFVLSLFRLAQRKNALIVIDELDISLDAAAQVKLIGLLKPILAQNQSKLLFTTHSLALMKTLHDGELYFMENQAGLATVKPRSYGYIKSVLFGFTGWDRVILVEDTMSRDYLEWLLTGQPGLVEYKVIHVGGHSQVVDLFDRARQTNYFNLRKPIQNLMCILDGDVLTEGSYAHRNDIHYLPFPSVEKTAKLMYDAGEFDFKLHGYEAGCEPKHVYNEMVKARPYKQPHIAKEDIFEKISAK
ncbi:MAG: AAA family ATPase, partial [Methyloprofundus sp.]|nr:AAA family ATPase [Methyloprofundus sp.]